VLEFSVKSGAPQEQTSACLIVGVFATGELTSAAKQLDKACDGKISALISDGEISGKAGETLLLHHLTGISAERVLLVGLGEPEKFALPTLIKATQAAIQALQNRAVADCISCLPQVDITECDLSTALRQSVIAASNAVYRFDTLKTKKNDPARLSSVSFILNEGSDLAQAEAALAQGSAIARGINLARDLANMPGNYCTPTTLAERAEQLAEQHSQLAVTVLDQKEMQELNMHALLAVARGSAQPPKLIVMEHKGGAASDAPVVLVGKGVTFDSGGISLKPGADMDQMKFDMGGAAATIGTMAAVAEMNLPINVTAVVPSVENMPDGSALKPGDVVTSMSGQTIEVLNTDAEGRLILCDALTYAERFNPAAVVDMATLTGACIISLGRVPSAILGNNQELIQALIQAGERSHDRFWELPLWDDYQEQLDSNFADMANIGGREGGTITAAAFLSRFTQNYPWAHLDIAGTAWKVGKDKGATGRPVAALSEFLMQRAGYTTN